MVFVSLKFGAGFIVADDGHIFRILLAKLFDFEDFMTWLYLCGPTYRAMGWNDVMYLSRLHLLPLVGAFVTALVRIVFVFFVMMIQAVKFLFDLKSGRRSGGVFVFHAFQATLFSVLGFGIRRLVLCVVVTCFTI